MSAASANFARARRVLELPPECPGCLMFTERAGDNWLESLRSTAGDLISDGWTVAPYDDGSIILVREAETLVLIPGRQTVTREQLEVLSLGCREAVGEAEPIRDVLRGALQRGAVPVIPWGFGKWIGSRGRVLRSLIEYGADVPFCVGDNGGRARRMPQPALLTLARRCGIPVLGGSDPLPVPAHVTRAGSYGFFLEGVRIGSRPVHAVLEGIRAMRESPPAFGDLNTVAGVFRAQLALRSRWFRTVGVAG